MGKLGPVFNQTKTNYRHTAVVGVLDVLVITLLLLLWLLWLLLWLWV